jgi:hypothetical protein
MDVFKVPAKPADHRIHYGPLEPQFGDLRLPSSVYKLPPPGKLAPLVVFLHGGWWQSAFDLNMSDICANPSGPMDRRLVSGVSAGRLHRRRLARNL